MSKLEPTSDPMSPAASPDAPGASPRIGVRRVNNNPLYIVVAAGLAFLLVMAIVASNRAAKQNQVDDPAKPKTGSTSMFAKEIAGDRQSGVVPESQGAPLAPDLYSNVPPAPPSVPLATPPTDLTKSAGASELTPPDTEQGRIRDMKMQRLDEAAQAKSGVQYEGGSRAIVGSRGAGATAAPATREDVITKLAAVRQQIESLNRDDPSSLYKARVEQIRASGMIGKDGGGSGGSSGLDGDGLKVITEKDPFAQFDKSGDEDRWRLDSKVQPPRTRYEMRAGYVIPGTLISGINSDLPGQIMGQVSQNVYDTATGKHLLIPQGSRLVGTYSSGVVYGQERVLVAWQRIIFPDAKAIDLGSMSGADAAGYSGLNDKVNNHYIRIFGSAFLMSAVTAGIALSQDQQVNPLEAQSASSAMSEAVGQQLGQATAHMLEKNLNIAPTLEIRPGFRINVMVTKDITFLRPYQSFDY